MKLTSHEQCNRGIDVVVRNNRNQGRCQKMISTEAIKLIHTGRQLTTVDQVTASVDQMIDGSSEVVKLTSHEQCNRGIDVVVRNNRNQGRCQKMISTEAIKLIHTGRQLTAVDQVTASVDQIMIDAVVREQTMSVRVRRLQLI